MLRKIAAFAVLFHATVAFAQDSPIKARDVAKLEEIQGQVTVQQGSGFVPGAPMQSLNEGDQVMAAGGASSAIVKYPDGCALTVAAGTVVTLPKLSTCACGIAGRETAPPASTPVDLEDVASIKEVQGELLVDRGAGFVPVALGEMLDENDRVRTADGASSGIVKYQDGCDIKVDPGTVVTIPQHSPCLCCGISTTRDDTAEGEATPENKQDVASLEEIEGSVLVNQGVEFVPGTLGQSLNENDRVMAEEGENSALLKYSDGCDIKVDPGTIVTVPENSPCLCGILLVQNAAPAGGAVIGAASTSALPIVFGGIVTGIIYIILQGDDDEVIEDDDDTVSP